MQRPNGWFLSVVIGLGASIGLAQGQPSIGTVDDLLDALETADAQLERVSSSVFLIKDFALAGDQEVRSGSLWYRRLKVEPGQGEAQEAEPKSVKQFKVRFDQTNTAGVVDQNPREYIFDGEWLVEKFINDKQFIKRQMVAPGEHWDPLRLGEGPFPVPIGQRRADILREFVAELSADPAEGLDHPRLIEQAQQSHQLVLRPRPELEATADYEIVRIWYDRQTLLPRMIRALDFTGDVSTVVLRDMLINADVQVSIAELDVKFDDQFDTTPPPVGSGWDVSVEPWRSSLPSTNTVEGAARIEHQIKVEAGP